MNHDDDDSGSHSFTIPDGIFACPTLEVLALQKCTLKLPRDYAPQVSSLRSLDLINVYISGKDFNLLLTLTLESLEQLSLINIHILESLLILSAPKLSNLRVIEVAPLRTISVSGAPCLSVFTLDLKYLMLEDDDDNEAIEGTNLVDLFMELSSVKRLCMEYLQYSREVKVPVDRQRVQMPQCSPPDCLLLNLSQLCMTISLADAGLVPILSCLLCSSPNLRVLEIEDDEYGIVSIDKEVVDGNYWLTRQIPRCLKHTLSSVKLQTVNIKRQSVMGFTDFILMNSCVLKTMEVNQESWLP